MTNLLLKRMVKNMSTKKKGGLENEGHLQTILYLNRNNSRKSIVNIYKKWNRKHKFIYDRGLPITGKSWWYKRLQQGYLQHEALLTALKDMYSNIDLSQPVFQLNDDKSKQKILYKKIYTKIEKNFILCIQTYLKLNRHNNLYISQKNRKLPLTKTRHVFPLQLFTGLNANFDSSKANTMVKKWAFLFNWQGKLNNLFKKLIKDLVIQDITINPSLEKEMKTDKYVDNDFLLNKTKNFKISSPYRQLRKMQRWFKKEQKDKLPRVKRIRPRVTIFERDHNWKRDISFNSFWFAKFINQFVKRGRKQFAEKTVYNVFKTLKFQSEEDAFLIFWKLLTKIKPILTTLPKRVGKLYHNIPVPIKFSTGYKIGFKWLLKGIKSHNNDSLNNRILYEIVATLGVPRSFTIKQRDILYHIANDNRTYSHYRWV